MAIFPKFFPIAVEVQAISRVPHNNALLYMPTDDDIRLITQDTSLPFWQSVL
jgi:hypothetical protein